METKNVIAALAALAHETRLSVFRRLVVAGDDGEPAGQVAEALKLPSPTLSFHLKEMERAGLVTSRRQGRRVFYAADFAGMRAVIDFLFQDCCRGHAAMRPGSATTINRSCS